MEFSPALSVSAISAQAAVPHAEEQVTGTEVTSRPAKEFKETV
jgi:hypothetical protein